MLVKIPIFILIAISFCLAIMTGCSSPTIDSNIQEAPRISEPPQSPSNSIVVGQDTTVGKLLKLATDRPEQFRFPCSLQSTLDLAQKDGLKRIRQHWDSTEDDSRFVLALPQDLSQIVGPSSCVCPSNCVLLLRDRTQPEPSNFAILVIDPFNITKGHHWWAKNVDLTGAHLTWTSSTPRLRFGTDTYSPTCAVENGKCILIDGRDVFENSK